MCILIYSMRKYAYCISNMYLLGAPMDRQTWKTKLCFYDPFWNFVKVPQYFVAKNTL